MKVLVQWSTHALPLLRYSSPFVLASAPSVRAHATSIRGTDFCSTSSYAFHSPYLPLSTLPVPAFPAPHSPQSTCPMGRLLFLTPGSVLPARKLCSPSVSPCLPTFPDTPILANCPHNPYEECPCRKGRFSSYLFLILLFLAPHSRPNVTLKSNIHWMFTHIHIPYYTALSPPPWLFRSSMASPTIGFLQETCLNLYSKDSSEFLGETDFQVLFASKHSLCYILLTG